MNHTITGTMVKTEPLSIDRGIIFKQICAVMADIDAIGKNQINQQQKFKFRGIDDVYNSLHAILAKHQIFTVPTVLTEEFKEETAKSGSKCTRAILKMKYTFYAIDGSSIEGVVIGEALDYGDKAANKAMAIAHKYFLMQTFIIPTEDKDPDSETFELAAKKAIADPDIQDGFIEHLKAAEDIEELKDIFAKAWKYAQEIKDNNFAHEIKTIYDNRKEELSK
jgi:hypothetical protein